MIFSDSAAARKAQDNCLTDPFHRQGLPPVAERIIAFPDESMPACRLPLQDEAIGRSPFNTQRKVTTNLFHQMTNAVNAMIFSKF
jgi:hypothetical protein